MSMFKLKQFQLSAVVAAFAVASTAYGGVTVANAQSGASCACELPTGTAGIIQSVAGNVFVSQASGSVPAQVATRLGAGDVVRVGPQSSSVVTFDGCELNLRGNTTFEILPQGEMLCLAVNEAGVGGSKPGLAVAAGVGALAVSAGVIFSIADDDKSVSR